MGLFPIPKKDSKYLHTNVNPLTLGLITVLTTEIAAVKNGQISLASRVSFYGDGGQEKHTRSGGDSGMEWKEA